MSTCQHWYVHRHPTQAEKMVWQRCGLPTTTGTRPTQRGPIPVCDAHAQAFPPETPAPVGPTYILPVGFNPLDVDSIAFVTRP